MPYCAIFLRLYCIRSIISAAKLVARVNSVESTLRVKAIPCMAATPKTPTDKIAAAIMPSISVKPD